MKKIMLDFGSFSLEAELFDTPVAEKFYARLPYDISLTQWGGELYGSLGAGADYGSHKPEPKIPEGGLAYTNRGNYFCVFFGQKPAWSVEYIGNITDDWNVLKDSSGLDRVTVRRAG